MRVNRTSLLATASVAMLALFAGIAPLHADDVTFDRILHAEKNPGDWLTYHGSYQGWHHSALNQVNTQNVGQLKVAWMHQPGRATRGVQSMPMAADGVLYYSSSYSKVYALDGATGEVLWAYTPQLDEDLVARQTHSPYNRGMAMGDGNLYVGTVDGRLIALDMKTGKPAWDTKLIDSKKLTVGFTGAPLFVKDKVIIGSQGGEWPGRGPIFGVDAKTGNKLWEFFTVAGTEESKSTWGNDSWRTGGGGGWMPGTYDAGTNTVWWGTGNPAPLYDWAGADWKTKGPRPGDNLYTTSVILLNPDTGELKGFHQLYPHDAWDFDASSGELMMVEQGGKKYVVHPTKGGFVFVFDRKGKPVNVYKGVDNINFVQDIKPDGTLVGRRDLPEGKHTNLCPAIAGGYSWNAGSYSPKTGLLYKVGYEWCIDLEVVRTEPITEPVVQLNIGANFTFVAPEGDKMRGHIRARDPITGKVKFEIAYPGAIPHA